MANQNQQTPGHKGGVDTQPRPEQEDKFGEGAGKVDRNQQDRPADKSLGKDGKEGTIQTGGYK